MVLLQILSLVFLEGILSLDNAVVLAVLVKDLEGENRRKALVYGIWGAMGFRLLFLFFAIQTVKFFLLKELAALYLIWMAVKYFWFTAKEDEAIPAPPLKPKFWLIVLWVELMDVAFSVDSILASLAVSDELWVLISGAVLGILMMRVAASYFVTLIEKFPWLEAVAYAFIAIIGVKLGAQGFGLI